MAKQIGLEGVFSLKDFDAGIRRYQSQLGRTVSDTNKAAGSFGKSWNEMGKTVGNVTKTMGVALVAAGAAAGAAITGFAVSGINKAKDLEAQMSNIAAVFNTTAEGVAPLQELILELGVDPNLKVSTIEAADAIEMLGKNGLSMAEIMDGAARSTVLLANATGADFSVAADIATDAMAIFGIEAANMDAAVNGITAVTVASKFSIDDYRLAIAQAAGVAGAVGVDFDDFNTTIAAISPSFASGSDAGTSFKTMLQRLLPQSTEAEEMMRELGIITADGANQFFTASGEMKSMNDIAVILNGALAGLSEEQKLQAVTTLAGADASRAMLGLMDAGAVVYTDAAEAAKALGVSQAEVNTVIEGGVTQFEALQLQMGKTDAVVQAQTRMDNLAGAMEILEGVIETIQIQIGQAFIPALTKLAQAFTALVEQNSDKIVGFFTTLADNIVALVGYFTEVATSGNTLNSSLQEMSPWLATVVLNVTNLAIAINSVLGQALSFIQQHMDAFKGALIAIAAVMAAATITAGITAMAGAIAALFNPITLIILAAAGLGIAWNTNWLGMRDKTLEAVAAIQEAFAPLTTAIQTFGSGALTEIQAFVTGNETEFTNLKAIWDGAQESFGNVFTGIQTAATGFLDYLKEQFPALTPVFDGFASAVALVSSQVGSQFTLLQDSTSALVSLVTSLIEGDWAGAWASAQELAGAFDTYVRDTFSNLSTFFTTTFGEFSPVITGAFTEIQNFVTGNETEFTNLKTIWSGAKTTFDTTFDGIRSWAGWTEIKTSLEDLGVDFDGLAEIIDAFKADFETVTSAIKTAWDGLVEIFEPAFTRLSEGFATLATDMQGMGGQFDEFMEAVGGLGTAFSDVWDVIGPILQQIGIAIGVALGSVAILAINLLASTFENMGSIIETVIDQATLIINTLATVVTETVNLVRAVIDGDWRSAWTSFRSIANSAMSLVRGSINNLLELAGKIGKTIYDAIVNTLEDLGLPDVENKAKKIWENIRDSAEDIFGVDLEAATPSSIFTTLGNAVIQGLIDGMWAKVEEIKTKLGEIKDEIITKWETFSWLDLGKSIVDGIGQGIIDAKDRLLGKINELAGFIPQWAKDALGISSPAKVMIPIGEAIIDGWILGMARNEHRILNAMRKISLSVSKIAHQAGQNTISEFSNVIGQFSTVAGGKLDNVDLLDMLVADPLDPRRRVENVIGLINRERSAWSFLKQQGELIAAIRDAGLDPSEVLAGLTLGANADPLKLAGVVGRTMAELNRGLEQSIKNAASGLTRTIDEMRAGRETIQGIEEEFTAEHLSILGNYATRLEGIDAQIAAAEEQVLRTGGAGMQHLRSLESQRKRLLAEVREFHEQRVQLEALLSTTPGSDNSRAQDAMDKWRAQWLDPIVKLFNEGDIWTRRSMWPTIQQRMKELQKFAQRIPEIANVERQAMQALEGFGQGARGRAENLLTVLYDPNQVVNLTSNVAALRKFAQELHKIKAEISQASGMRIGADTMIERVVGSFDQLTAYKNAIASIDAQIERVQASVLETGNLGSMASIRNLDTTRKASQQELETFLRQTQRLADIMGQVKNLSGPGQAAAERFLQEVIQPITDAFNAPMRAIDRDAWLRAAKDRVDTLNRFVLQMRQVERLQARVAGNQGFAHLADDFALMQDMLMPENTRAGLIVKLDDYITQMMRFQEIQQDISQGRGINPFVERFASERLDGIARQLEDINLSEAQRNQLIHQYRIEQEKILALQQKQQQLDFINQQLALIDQLRSLDDEEDWSVDVEHILSGINFGINASIDDLMRLTGSVINELIRFTNHELGIASPSKVFARVGENIMAGLAAGVESGLRLPMNALRNAAGALVPYSLQQRALTINMGGVTINDRVDAALFENRIRQVVRNEFAS